MRLLAKVVVALLVLGLGGWLILPTLANRWHESHKPNYRQAPVSRGEIISVVNSTGTVKPVFNVQIGAWFPVPFKTCTWTSTTR